MIRWLPLVPLLDSNFPTGSFAHSFGMETAYAEGHLSGPGAVLRWLEDLLWGNLATFEGPAVRLAWQLRDGMSSTTAHELSASRIQEAGELVETQEPVEKWPSSEQAKSGGAPGESEETKDSVTAAGIVQTRLLEIDRHLTVSRLAAESRGASIKMGRRYLRTVCELYPGSLLHVYEQWVKAGRAFGQMAVVHGWLCRELDYSEQEAVASFLYGSLNALTQNATRLTAIGQTNGQKILLRLLPQIEQSSSDTASHSTLNLDNLFIHTVNQEVQAMRHESLYSRIFMS